MPRWAHFAVTNRGHALRMDETRPQYRSPCSDSEPEGMLELSQPDVEHGTGIPKARISRYEHGRVMPMFGRSSSLGFGLMSRSAL
jgi:hypothetical protein